MSPQGTHTFDALTTLDKKELDRIMDEGRAPEIEDVLGYEFRGWNLQEATKLLGTRKFKKGFEIETALNYYADHPGRPQHKVFAGLTQTVKEKKYGLMRGTFWRWRMVFDILATHWVLHTTSLAE